MDMWVGVEPLLTILVLSLPIVWIMDWRFSSNEQSSNLRSILFQYLLFMNVLIVFQGILGHIQSPSHQYAVFWGVSDSILQAIQYFSNGPEGRLLLVSMFYLIYISIREKTSSQISVTLFSFPLIPLIAIGTSAGSFEPVQEAVASSYAPSPTFYPLFATLAGGILLGEAMYRTAPFFSDSKLNFLETRIPLVLWLIISGIVLYSDSISTLPPSESALLLILLVSTTIIADIIGGISENSPQSKRETWPSLAFTFFLIGVAFVSIRVFLNELTLSSIGTLSITSAIGSQIPSIGFDNRNRSSHRGAILGASSGSCLLVIFGPLERISVLLLGLLFMIIPISWNMIDRIFGKSKIH